MMKSQFDRNKIREFLDLVENERYDLRKYTKPVLVYLVDEFEKVKYSLWEQDMLNRFGIENVDGWDYEEDIVFCPDWVQDEFDEEFEDDDDWDDDDD